MVPNSTKMMLRCSLDLPKHYLQKHGHRHLSSKAKESLIVSGDWEKTFTNLKLALAQKLTDSLPDKERKNLIESIGPDYVESKSIGEAVAAAQAKEQDFQEEWVRKMEEAAVNRVETEYSLRLAAEQKLVRLQSEAAQQRRERVEEIKYREQQQQKLKSDDTPGLQQDYVEHPVLGHQLVDLGYKRVYLSSAAKLASIPVWEKQRAYRHARAKMIAHEKLRKKDIGLPGVIALFETRTGDLSILDGQHRVGMLTILQQTTSKKTSGLVFDMNEILVEVFPETESSDEFYAADLFADINKAEPVKLIDMPGEADTDTLRIINPAADMIENMFPDMFKPNIRCMPPHVNIDNFRMIIFNGGILKRHNIKDSEALVKWILRVNERHEEKYKRAIEQWESGSTEILYDSNAVVIKKYSDRVMKKALQKGFYLGLDSTWVY